MNLREVKYIVSNYDFCYWTVEYKENNLPIEAFILVNHSRDGDGVAIAMRGNEPHQVPYSFEEMEALEIKHKNSYTLIDNEKDFLIWLLKNG
jgi:hypothetical protein